MKLEGNGVKILIDTGSKASLISKELALGEKVKNFEKRNFKGAFG
ncbi:hypothetical protein A3Q56_08269, partial [Intoshia linei]